MKYSTTIGLSAAGGAGAGYLVGRYKAKKKGLTGKDKRKVILTATGVGAVTGAATGAGVKALQSKATAKYQRYVGYKPKTNDHINISDYKKGDMIAYDRGGYEHYGIVIDNKGNTIEFKRHDNPDPSKASVVKTNILDSAEGSKIRKVVNRTNKYTPDEIVKRAEKHVGSNLGGYNLTNNNCEHFVRLVAEGKRESTQVSNAANKSPIVKFMVDYSKSKYKQKAASDKSLSQELSQIASPIAMDGMYYLRKNIKNKQLGGMTNFQRNQTAYLTAGGGLVGAGVGTLIANKKFKKLAKKQGLEKGTPEYKALKKKYLKKGVLIGAGTGAVAGAGTSMAMDAIRGKITKDKIKNSYGFQIETDNRRIGKAFRGINSEDQFKDYGKNWKTIYQYQVDTLI